MKHFRNSWILNRPLHLAHAEGCFCAVSKNVSYVLTVSFIKNTKSAHIPAATALKDTACLTGHAKHVWTQDTVCDLYADSPRILSADFVHNKSIWS
jgi:hypothetical protein